MGWGLSIESPNPVQDGVVRTSLLLLAPSTRQGSLRHKHVSWLGAGAAVNSGADTVAPGIRSTQQEPGPQLRHIIGSAQACGRHSQLAAWRPDAHPIIRVWRKQGANSFSFCNGRKVVTPTWNHKVSFPNMGIRFRRWTVKNNDKFPLQCSININRKTIQLPRAPLLQNNWQSIS